MLATRLRASSALPRHRACSFACIRRARVSSARRDSRGSRRGLAGGELHLLPAAVLRDRGVLERTIRHELVHVMTDEPLAGRPAWVREGAALYFSGGRTDAAERSMCPDDIEFQQPTSAGALSNAYARALACFTRQVRNGRSWKDVK